MATNGKAPPETQVAATERDRIRQAMEDLQARLSDLQVRDRQIHELKEFLKKRTLLTRQDVMQAAAAVIPGRPQRANVGKSNHPAKGKYGTMLRALRQRESWSIEELGRQLGVSGATIYAWETGRYRPKGDRITAIMDLVEPSHDVKK